MKRIKCINAINYNLSLTEGKYYDVYDEDEYKCLIKDDRRMKIWLHKDRFAFNLDASEIADGAITTNKLREREYGIQEILNKRYVNEKFKIVGERDVYEVCEISGEIYLRTAQEWGVIVSVNSKILNSRFIKVETFKIGEVVQSKKTNRFYKIFSIEGSIIHCVNSSVVPTSFSENEIRKISTTTLNDLKVIFGKENLEIPF